MTETPRQPTFPHTPFVPYDPTVQFYETAAWNFGGDAEAWEYTGWRDETAAGKTTVPVRNEKFDVSTIPSRFPARSVEPAAQPAGI